MNAALQRARRPLAASVAVAAALYLGAIALADGPAVLARISGLPSWGVLLALALPAAGYAVRFGRWDVYLRQMGHALPRRAHARIYMAGFALTTTPGKVGENLRAVYLEPWGVPYADSFGAFVAERMADLLAMVLLSGLTVRLVGSHSWALALSVAVTLGLLLLLRDPRLARALAARVGGEGRMRRLVDGLARALDASRGLLALRPLALGVGIGLLAWGAEAFTFALVAGFMGVEVPVTVAMGIFAVGTLVGALSFLPGGVGPTEAVMAGLLVAAGGGLAEATAATVLIRVFTLWWAVLLGIGALAGLGSPREPARHPTGAGRS